MRHRRRRRWLRAERDPGSTSPIFGKAAHAALVLAVVWQIFTIFATVWLNPDFMEVDAQAAFRGMHSTWAWTAFLAAVLVAVDALGRLAGPGRRDLRRFGIDLLALALLIQIMVSGGQWERYFATRVQDLQHPWISTHTVQGEFRYPGSLVPGSTANDAWLEFQEWLDRYTFGATAVQLEFGPEQPVQRLAQCTPALWRARYEDVRIRVRGGESHALRPPPYGGYYYDLLVPAEDGGLDDARLLGDLEVRGLGDQVDPEVDVLRTRRVYALAEAELDARIEKAQRWDPLPVLVPRDATMEWLDALLTDLEERGAEHIALVFHG